MASDLARLRIQRLRVAARTTLVAGIVFASIHAVAQTLPPNAITIGHIRSAAPERIAISLLERPADDNAVAGARLAIEDNNTTGQFTNQRFQLAEVAVTDTAQAVAALESFASENINFVVTDLPAEMLLAVADAAAAPGILVLNGGASDDVLRMEECRANVIHIAPSRAMLGDALAQYLVWKKWTRWFLIVGSHDADRLYADALKRAASRFGAEVVEERVFEDTGGARTTDSGTVQVQRLMPVFTQNAPAHDVVVIADESEVFGAYVPFRTWTPAPVAGTDGLSPTSWSSAHDSWGAIQLQNRFVNAHKRRMTEKDLNSWTAVRMIGEAATRMNSVDPKEISGYIKGPEFKIAAFKGVPLTIRDWDLQLRQPVLLDDGRVVVSVSPQEGFLHQTSVLDTLGYDRPETKCSL
jgi:ABC transporter substrate binding protein (PQQ-dependent alcohol dehydrogenase system)